MNKDSLISILRQEGHSDLIVKAFQKIKRENFVSNSLKNQAYQNTALSTLEGQTISQPSCIAMMFSFLKLDELKKKKDAKILEIGSGTGYVLALLTEMLPNAKIYGLEIKSSLAKNSTKLLKNKKNIKIFNKSGIKGYETEAPYDIILISASAQSENIVFNLTPQLKDNGIIISPVGYDLISIKKTKNKLEKTALKNAVTFVPLVDN